ncbi:armadillo-type protein, partial [Phakopsora pachyrhizi]
FISELTKFRLLKPHSILHLIKVLVDDLNNVNVDNLCNLLEGCGRFVLKDSKTNLKMVQLLEQMKKKKTSQNLDSRQVMMLENAYYQVKICDPGDRPIVEPKVRTPIELFIRYQMYDCLSKKTLDGVIKILRKLPWNDPTVLSSVSISIILSWLLKLYMETYLFAIVAYDLSKFHPAFTVSVVDQVLENIRFHMETNVFKLNQQRISSVKYLGELYNYRIIDSRVIFDTLWSFVTFGHRSVFLILLAFVLSLSLFFFFFFFFLKGRFFFFCISPIDTPDDFFKVRLVCTLLSTCGHCFDRGSLKKRLNNFLKFFIVSLLLFYF